MAPLIRSISCLATTLSLCLPASGRALQLDMHTGYDLTLTRAPDQELGCPGVDTRCTQHRLGALLQARYGLPHLPGLRLDATIPNGLELGALPLSAALQRYGRPGDL